MQISLFGRLAWHWFANVTERALYYQSSSASLPSPVACLFDCIVWKPLLVFWWWALAHNEVGLLLGLLLFRFRAHVQHPPSQRGVSDCCQCQVAAVTFLVKKLRLPPEVATDAVHLHPTANLETFDDRQGWLPDLLRRSSISRSSPSTRVEPPRTGASPRVVATPSAPLVKPGPATPPKAAAPVPSSGASTTVVVPPWRRKRAEAFGADAPVAAHRAASLATAASDEAGEPSRKVGLRCQACTRRRSGDRCSKI